MDITICKNGLKGTVKAPPSKSYMHRALICAAAADCPTKIECSEFSEDTKATMRCLEALGAKFSFDDKGVTVTPIDKKQSGICELDCGESGSTLRFILPFAAASGKECILKGSERLGKRPLKPLIEELRSHGIDAQFSGDFLPLKISGKLTGGKFEIPADISSQFISGLLMALGVSGGGEIHTLGTLKSKKYVDITVEVMEKFGVNAEKTDFGYSVPQKSGYTSPIELSCEGDWSNAAFWLVGGAISAEEGLTCTALSKETTQGDFEIYNILKKMGADISIHEDKVTVRKSKLLGINIVADDIPDLVPILCVAACGAEGKTVISGTKRLREKESDRVKSTLDMINSLGGIIECSDNSITVTPKKLTGGKVDSYNDHRIAMSAAIASLISEKGVEIIGAEAVRKSYPDFFEVFEKTTF